MSVQHLSGVSIEDSTVDELVLMLSSQEMSAPNSRPPQVTRSISVPTSEHVAQIVGKSGSKIKNLRAATQTCIKTPLRGDEPVFTVSGTEPNVERVINCIKQASDHFTRLIESRSNVCSIGEVTLLVQVPKQYVGVVVGRNGTVIMKIKEQTRTRINTPKGDSDEPAFEVTGTMSNVTAAKEAIEDKVRQAYMLKESSPYDPELSHKANSLSEELNWLPGRPLPIMRSVATPQTTTTQMFNYESHANNSRLPSLPPIGWPPMVESRVPNRAPSPQLFNPYRFQALPFGSPLSSPFMDSTVNSFQF